MPASRIDGRMMGNDRPGTDLDEDQGDLLGQARKGWHATPVDYAAV